MSTTTPTTIEGQLIAILVADAGVSALIGNRIHPFNAPQNLALPKLTWQRPMTDRSVTIGAFSNDGPSGLSVATVQFDCFAADPLTCKSVCSAVRRALNGYSGGTIGCVRVDDERDLPSVPIQGQQMPMQRAMISVSVAYADS